MQHKQSAASEMPGVTWGMCELDRILFFPRLSRNKGHFCSTSSLKMEMCNLHGGDFLSQWRWEDTRCSNYTALLPGRSFRVLKRTRDCVNTPNQMSWRPLFAPAWMFYKLNIVWCQDSVGPVGFPGSSQECSNAEICPMRYESAQRAGGVKANTASPVRATSCSSKRPCNWAVLSKSISTGGDSNSWSKYVQLATKCRSALVRSFKGLLAANMQQNKSGSSLNWIFSSPKWSSSFLLSHVHTVQTCKWQKMQCPN